MLPLSTPVSATSTKCTGLAITTGTSRVIPYPNPSSSGSSSVPNLSLASSSSQELRQKVNLPVPLPPSPPSSPRAPKGASKHAHPYQMCTPSSKCQQTQM